MSINPFESRKEERNRILAGKDEIVKKKEIEELDKMFEMEDMKDRFEFAAKVLKDHNGLESSIPINHPYWKLRP